MYVLLYREKELLGTYRLAAYLGQVLTVGSRKDGSWPCFDGIPDSGAA